MTPRYMYAFAYMVGERLQTVRIYAYSAREAFYKLVSLVGIAPQQLRGIRVRECTNKARREGIK